MATPKRKPKADVPADFSSPFWNFQTIEQLNDRLEYLENIQSVGLGIGRAGALSFSTPNNGRFTLSNWLSNVTYANGFIGNQFTEAGYYHVTFTISAFNYSASSVSRVRFTTLWSEVGSDATIISTHYHTSGHWITHTLSRIVFIGVPDDNFMIWFDSLSSGGANTYEVDPGSMWLTIKKIA